MDRTTPVRTEIQTAFYEDNTLKVGVGIKKDYNNKGEIIKEERGKFFQLKNKPNYYLGKDDNY